MEDLQQAVKSVAPGCYIVAVSGGVDSMALLDILRRRTDIYLIVAHVNHGMRTDAAIDQRLVEEYCASHNITFCSTQLHLGVQASEARARQARYRFLRQCRIKYNALAIITAHHQDDLTETAILNILRGTSWRGTAPFVRQDDVLRPLLNVPKKQLLLYAKQHNIPWREDFTNNQTMYLRNYVRNVVMPLLDRKSSDWHKKFLQQVRKQQALRRKIEAELSIMLTLLIIAYGQKITGQRYNWIMLPETLRYECFQTLCRTHLGASLVKPRATAACLFIKTALPGKVMPLNKDWHLRVTRRDFVVEPCHGVVK